MHCTLNRQQQKQLSTTC